MGLNPDALYNELLDDLREACPPLDSILDLGLPPEATLSMYRAYAMASSFMKKFVNKKSPDADKRCLEKFLAVNDRCGAWAPRPETLRDELLLGHFREEVAEFLEPHGTPIVSSYYDILERGRAGPGASLGAAGNDFYSKMFSSCLTVTSSWLYDTYADWLTWRPTWVEAEISRILHWDVHKLERSSKLCFVPKTNDISRTIAVEPSLNMFYQLGLGNLLSDRLISRFGIDIERQPDINRELARLGSVDGSFSTIDLSSASDSISRRLCFWACPRWFYDILDELRTPNVRLENGELIELNMISTMGNGFTFPLETMLFSCAVAAIDSFHGKKSRWSVFGDDIVCEASATRDLIRLIDLLGFTVNRDKTFVEGPFRESCGRDFFRGQDVRGVFCKSLQTLQDRYVAINRLTLWCCVTGIRLPRTLGALRRSVKRFYVPLYESDDAGIKIPFFYVKGRYDRATLSALYVCWVPHATKLRIFEDRISVPKGQKKRSVNPAGLILSALHGSYVNGAISVKHNRVRYRTKLRIAPYWDYAGGPDSHESAWRRGGSRDIYSALS